MNVARFLHHQRLPFWLLVSLGFYCINTTTPSRAAIVTFDLGGTAGSAGSSFTSGSSTVTKDAISLSVQTDPADSYFAFSIYGGVNSPTETGLARARIDSTENVTFTVVSSTPTFELVSIDMDAVTGTVEGEREVALISINEASPIEVGLGTPNFSVATERWTPNLTLASGSTVGFTTNGEFSLQYMTLRTIAVPEPASLTAATMALPLLLVAWYRRHTTEPSPINTSEDTDANRSSLDA
ncbi:hypothetical protein N9N28_10175 [Rubripirellula amarantea]|uniref:Uncharacterized protein n=1 Tax=Rubripirellula amarantea TaxID=2527999 RepID=A0A5C5WQ12_9BACT|nr:hypothetical protein [Rubripirellula amarantea]MDA8744986.1 hypothetical protein [Rubripirellula amarantea]TWT52856.1 hypothetical protein Pla22_04840 [Rubripirellula amarantea]